MYTHIMKLHKHMKSEIAQMRNEQMDPPFAADVSEVATLTSRLPRGRLPQVVI